MPVICRVCQRSFGKLITNTHLKSHNMTTQQYSEQFGPEALSSPEYRAERAAKYAGEGNPMFGRQHSEEVRAVQSRNRSGRPAHNKGKAAADETKETLRIKALERNRRWTEQGNHPLVGQKRSDETRRKIREARSRQIITAEQVYKAIETKKARGYDLAFFRGHKHTAEAVNRISQSSRKNWAVKKIAIADRYLQKIADKGFMLGGDLSDHFLLLTCTVCNHQFKRVKQVFHDSKITDKICENCHPRQYKSSQAEDELYEFLTSTLGISTVMRHVRSLITPLEVDFHLPDHSLAIEYCGIYWHSELAGKDRNYHLFKMDQCRKKNTRLITIFENEWITKPDIIRSMLAHTLGSPLLSIGARKCRIVSLRPEEANGFLNANHRQGAGRSNIRYGLIHDDRLVSVMTFNQSNISRRTVGTWELNRFASLASHRVPGAASRLFTHFLREQDPDQVVSYADRRWSVGGVYEALGFTMVDPGVPNYWYFLPNSMELKHRYALRKRPNDDPSLTEWENRRLQGWNRIWDCGSLKYVWLKKKGG